MRPVSVTLGAAGFSDWIGINRMSMGNFGIGLGVVITSGASLTYSVQHTFDSIYTPTQEWSASRSGTTATITLTNHGLSAGSWVSFDGPAPLNQAYDVAGITDANTFTVTVANSGATTWAIGSGYNLWKAAVFEHATITAKTTSSDGNYAFPPIACRLKITTYVSGKATLNVIPVG